MRITEATIAYSDFQRTIAPLIAAAVLVISVVLSRLTLKLIRETFRKSWLQTLCKARQAKKNLVPSPAGYPIIGHLPLLGHKPYISLAAIGQNFEGLFRLNFATREAIVLDRLDVIAEANKDPAFLGRPHLTSIKIFEKSAIGKNRFGMADPTPKWKFLRHAAVRAISTVTGSMKSRVEEIVGEAVEGMKATIQERQREGKDGRPAALFPSEMLGVAVGGIVGAINFGTEFNRDDPLIKHLREGVRVTLDFLQVGRYMDNVPFGRLFFYRKIKNFLANINALNRMITKSVEQRQPSKEIRDICDVLQRIARETQETRAAIGISESEITFIAEDLFLGAFTGCLDNLQWLLNIVAAKPEIQRRLHQEIDAVLGTTGPTLAHRGQMPFAEATIMECFRFVTLSPLGFPRATTQPTTLRGHFIPTATMVITNAWAVHHNEAIFPGPDEFRPSRFLRQHGSFDVELASRVILFGVGKRRCPGELMSRQLLFLLLTSILSNYEISPVDGEIIDINECVEGLVRQPVNYKLRFTARNITGVCTT